MKTVFSLFLLLPLLALGCAKKPEVSDIKQETESAPQTQSESEKLPQNSDEQKSPQDTLISPIDRALERVTKKKFGLKVSPQNSPVSPERFSGYHNAVDFEALPGEEDADVSVRSICAGKLIRKQTTSGYGGVLVQSCEISGQAVTVIYGHIRLSSVTESVESTVTAGHTLGVLGTGFSKETDGERKHLHLGIHKGATVDIRGYVQSETELRNWIDITTLIQ